MKLNNIKSRFPVFKKNPNLIFFDTAASALKVDTMIEAINKCYSEEYANIHRGVYELSSNLTKKYEDSRLKVAQFIKSPSQNNIIFTKSATEGINLVSSCMGNDFFNSGDEIIISYLEHHANIIPWHLLQKKVNIKIVPIAINKIGEIDYKDLISKISDRTKLIALCHMSNVTGSITNFDTFNNLIKQRNIALLIDGCQYTPHHSLDIRDIDPDFYVFSAHKLYGPSGLGILYMKDKWFDILSPYQGGGSMIKDVSILESSYAEGFEKFEAGTPPIAEVIGLSAAIDFLNQINLNNIFEYELDLHNYMIEKLKKINGIKIYGESKNKGAIISFNIENLHYNDVALLMDKKNIAIRSGHHCAQPLMKFFNTQGMSRLSFGIYNNDKDVDYFADSLKEVINILK
tara:strand:- start:17489 stop:18694 length:1206 start_codon:yes stop_codon:yes gene_type:complete